MTPTRFPIVLLKPLGHRSPLERRGWDSNPRTPCERHGLANRSLGPLGHPSETERAPGGLAPPAARRLPLQGSNLDFPDPESGVLPVTPRGTEYPFPIAGSIPPRAGSDYDHRFSRSGRRGSNPRPSAWEADALPTELLPQDPAEFTAVKPLSARSARRTELLPHFPSPCQPKPPPGASPEPPVGFEPTTARFRIGTLEPTPDKREAETPMGLKIPCT